MSGKIKMPAAGSLIVRMYNVGFGDSFLLVFPGPDRPRKVLIDCGRHLSTESGSGLKMQQAVERIIEDVTDDDGVARIDVVIATHRHMDHVDGFKQDEWENVQVREVWMPWTEHPADPQAKKIRESQSKKAEKAKKAAEKKKKLALTPAEQEKAEQAMVLASNNLVNAKAMETLHSGFSRAVGFVPRRYLPETANGESFDPEALPGVKVHVMGPSRDPDVIALMEKDDEFFHLLEEEMDSGGRGRQPFRASSWRVEREDYESEYGHLKLTKKEVEQINGIGIAEVFGAAAKVEDAVNGTSLMLMFEIGDAYLLFPGDAQWGTWNAALNHPEWSVLLGKTTFYKVGHHGSHNATPKRFVKEILQPDFWAMACTGPTEKWKKIIPRPTLIEALREKSKKVVRSDGSDVPDPALSEFERDRDNIYTQVEIRF